MKVRSSKKLKKEFASFIENHPPAEFSSRLRYVFLDWLRYEEKAGTAPLFLYDFLWSMNDLFDLLDEAAKEFPTPNHKP